MRIPFSPSCTISGTPPTRAAKIVADVLDETCEGQVIEPGCRVFEHCLVAAAADEHEVKLGMGEAELACDGDDELLTLLAVIESADVTDDDATREAPPDGARSSFVDRQAAGRAVNDPRANASIVPAHDVGDLCGNRDDEFRATIRAMREPVMLDGIVDAPRRDIGRARNQRAHIRAVNAASLVHVHEVYVMRRARYTE
jgi:hypothetical protein